MKATNLLSLVLVFSLLGTTLVVAHGPSGPDDGMNTPAGDHHTSMMDHSEHMKITATIDVVDSIQLKIEVSPDQESMDHMDNRNEHMRDDFSNYIMVEFYELVEFLDNSSNGYSDDDSFVSNYNLNNVTLAQPIEFSDNQFVITSNDDNTFNMTIDLNFEDGMLYGLKWSIDINYEFVSNITYLAMLHRVETKHGRMMEQNRNRHMSNGYGEYMRYEHNYMNDSDNNVLMFMNWESSVTVDGIDQSVTATSFDDIFAISIPQGDNIYYDPQIGADPNSIGDANSQISELFGFWNSLSIFPIFIIFIGLLSITGLYRNKK